MRSVFVFVGALVVLLVLFSSGAVTGDLCLKKVGCAHATGDGFAVDSRFPAKP